MPEPPVVNLGERNKGPRLRDVDRFTRLDVVRMMWTERYFWCLKRRTRGMLPALVYRRLYELVTELPDLPFVEVGAGAGASSIALGKAVKDSHKSAPIISIEKCEGGSRAWHGGFEDTDYRLLTSNLARFGVLDRVRLFTKRFDESGADELLSIIGSSRIAGFMHDADGRLDRDFAVLWPMVVPNGLIVVDDYGSLDVEALLATGPRSARKKLMIRRGLDLLIDVGMFVPEWRCLNTMFGRKPDGVSVPPAIFSGLKQVLDTTSQEVRDRLRSSGLSRRP